MKRCLVSFYSDLELTNKQPNTRCFTDRSLAAKECQNKKVDLKFTTTLLCSAGGGYSVPKAPNLVVKEIYYRLLILPESCCQFICGWASSLNYTGQPDREIRHLFSAPNWCCGKLCWIMSPVVEPVGLDNAYRWWHLLGFDWWRFPPPTKIPDSEAWDLSADA